MLFSEGLNIEAVAFLKSSQKLVPANAAAAPSVVGRQTQGTGEVGGPKGTPFIKALGALPPGLGVLSGWWCLWLGVLNMQ